MSVKKENKYFALIIPNKDWDEFMAAKPEFEPLLNNISKAYAEFRKGKGKNPYNNYIICNHDEPYAKEVWNTILRGEKMKNKDTSIPDETPQERVVRLLKEISNGFSVIAEGFTNDVYIKIKLAEDLIKKASRDLDDKVKDDMKAKLDLFVKGAKIDYKQEVVFKTRVDSDD